MPSTNNIATGWYHSVLRVSALLLALALVVQSGVISPETQTFSHLAGQQFATVIQATADPLSPSDQVAQIAQTESTEATTPTTQAISQSTFLISGLLFIILLLIILNYILHHLRHKEQEYLQSKSV